MKKEYFVEIGKVVDTDVWYIKEGKPLTTIECKSFTNARDIAVDLICDLVHSFNGIPDGCINDLYTKKRVQFRDNYIMIKSRTIWGE